MLLSQHNAATSKTIAVVMAGGRGSRMQSALPKSLHKIGEESFLEHILRSLNELPLRGICVVLWEANYRMFLPVLERFQAAHPGAHPLAVCLQQDPGGTAYAAACLAALWPEDLATPEYCQAHLLEDFGVAGIDVTAVESVLICPGDTPALCSATLRHLLDDHQVQGASLSLIGCYFANPFGYGRMVCDEQGQLLKIVEQKDATPTEQAIQLCYSGVMVAQLRPLFFWLAQVRPNHITGEYYLTDVIKMACAGVGGSHGVPRGSAKLHYLVAESAEAFLGINSPKQRVVVEHIMQG